MQIATVKTGKKYCNRIIDSMIDIARLHHVEHGGADGWKPGEKYFEINTNPPLNVGD